MAHFLRDVANHEGRSEAIWLHHNGLPTTGISHPVPTFDSFKNLGWIHKNPGEPATPQELQETWDTVQALRQQGKFGPHYPAHWFAQKTNLVLPDEKVNDLFIQDVRDVLKALGDALGQDAFLATPEPAQEALADIAFSLRPNFAESAVWKALAPAIGKGDWQAAAKASERPEASKRRNDWTKAKLEEAAKEAARSAVPGGVPERAVRLSHR